MEAAQGVKPKNIHPRIQTDQGQVMNILFQGQIKLAPIQRHQGRRIVLLLLNVVRIVIPHLQDLTHEIIHQPGATVHPAGVTALQAGIIQAHLDHQVVAEKVTLLLLDHPSAVVEAVDQADRVAAPQVVNVADKSIHPFI